jgi:hypothetical protein
MPWSKCFFVSALMSSADDDDGIVGGSDQVGEDSAGTRGRESVFAPRAPRRSVVLADHLDGVFDPRLEREPLKRHEHVPDLLPSECLAVNDDERQANIAARIPLDPADEAVSLS